MSTETTQTTTSDTVAPTSSNAANAPAAKKRVRRPAKKAATKPAAKKTSAKVKTSVKATSKAIVVEVQKLKKPKLVRDSFTFPKDEYQAIAALKQKALGLKHSTKKSEILRAGLKLLSGLSDKAFLAALSNVPALKTGRPAKS